MSINFLSRAFLLLGLSSEDVSHTGVLAGPAIMLIWCCELGLCRAAEVLPPWKVLSVLLAVSCLCLFSFALSSRPQPHHTTPPRLARLSSSLIPTRPLHV